MEDLIILFPKIVAHLRPPVRSRQHHMPMKERHCLRLLMKNNKKTETKTRVKYYITKIYHLTIVGIVYSNNYKFKYITNTKILIPDLGSTTK